MQRSHVRPAFINRLQELTSLVHRGSLPPLRSRTFLLSSPPRPRPASPLAHASNYCTRRAPSTVTAAAMDAAPADDTIAGASGPAVLHHSATSTDASRSTMPASQHNTWRVWRNGAWGPLHLPSSQFTCLHARLEPHQDSLNTIPTADAKLSGQHRHQAKRRTRQEPERDMNRRTKKWQDLWDRQVFARLVAKIGIHESAFRKTEGVIASSARKPKARRSKQCATEASEAMARSRKGAATKGQEDEASARRGF
ncbi:hypothetical protein BU23DRAFT_569926 [Bimuria novae-zelandiae CBS 107.79]|uniref:Uncharacterized protein n=1 Tax=Bimuria novae-zelandiae CBS 107.79 TaxID=1447943 RepID=A0A6A5V5B2_9PLEO|nr:hypothetical protein BU23DRAFT_569926 [Bimuria novae-zelandiae CBS 107.79]